MVSDYRRNLAWKAGQKAARAGKPRSAKPAPANGEQVERMPNAPCIIPFGENIVMTNAGLVEGRAIICVRAVGDDFVGSSDPSEAWEANERNGGPAWFLSFATAKSARAMAKDCEALADALEPSAARAALDNKEPGHGG